jgi:hypothetical protein
MEHEHTGERPSFWKSPIGVVCTLVAIATSAYLWFAHKDHVLALLPYAFLAACPLMHMFMHKGHHGHHHGGAQQPEQRVSNDG